MNHVGLDSFDFLSKYGCSLFHLRALLVRRIEAFAGFESTHGSHAVSTDNIMVR